MIKVGITGAESAVAGELLRILINHPEVEITTLQSNVMSGRSVSASHHGFIGEEIVNFTESIDPSSLDVLFVTDGFKIEYDPKEEENPYPDLKIIDITGQSNDYDRDFQYGLSEINRKAIVRCATKAVIPATLAVGALISLYPLASSLLLSDEISMEISAPADIVAETDVDQLLAEITSQLQKAQNSFEGKIECKLKAFDSQRIVRTRISMKCPLSLEEIEKIYDEIYDDHNFTFTTVSDVTGREIEGTQKCIVTYKKHVSDRLDIDCWTDGRLRGGAGDAVHIMNLMFSLYEKTGLTLKPSRYATYIEGDSAKKSWFA